MPAPKYPQVELATSFKKPGQRLAGGGLHAGLQGEVPLQQSPRTGTDWVARGRPTSTAFHPVEPAGRGAPTRASPKRGGGLLRQRRAGFINSEGTAEAGTEGRGSVPAGQPPAQSQPFFMVVSLVNPHDVLLYPKTYQSGGL